MNQVISSKLSSFPSATVSARPTQRKGPSTVVSHPAQLGSPPLVACITACNESPEELQFCLETFHGESPVDLDLDAIYVILDGCPDEDMQANNQTFQALVSIMGLQVPPGGAGASILEGGCRVYVGEVGSIPARLYVKGHGEFQRSKRRSIMAFYDVLGERIASGTCEEPMAVLHMDADTGSSEPGRSNSMTSFGLENVARLLRIMRNDDNLGALATQVRVLHRTKNTLALMQSFDCNSTYVGINGGTGLVGRSTACLGMTVMYRYSTLYASHVEGVLSPMAAFSRIADHNIVDHVNLDMNEDQGMTTFIMRAGYDTRTSLITRFYTFAPENIAELLGQRRRWQVGFLVGLPYQMFGSPSPHLQLSKARWLTALFLTNVYVNVLLMPGTLGFCLAFLFEQAFIGVVQLLRDISSDTADCDGIHVGIDTTHITTGPFDNGGRTECAGSAMIDSDEAGSFARQAMFAACTWSFWLAFVAATIGRAPKEVHVRCQFFFTAASVVTVAIIVTAALVSRAGQAFLGILLGSNAVVGLLLTSNIREWPHRLQELLPYCLFLCAVKPMITLYAVANVDSALWGTRSVGDVKNTSEDDASSTTSVSETDSDSDSAEDTMMRPLAVSRGHWANARVTSATVRATIAQGAVEEKAIPLTCADTEDLAIHVDEAQNALTNGSLREKSGGGEERGARKANAAGLLSLRSWKFVLLVPWVLLNVIVTVVYVQWSIPTFAALGFFGNVTGQTLFVVAAWLEMRRQRRAAMRSPPPSVFADSPAVGSASLTAPSV